jgi:hypothetical protein
MEFSASRLSLVGSLTAGIRELVYAISWHSMGSLVVVARSSPVLSISLAV